MEINTDKEGKLAEWLNNISEAVELESDNHKKTRLNSKYIGGIKLIEAMGGKVVYKPKHIHTVSLKAIPTETDIQGFTTTQTIGAAEMLLHIDVYPIFRDNILTI